MKDVVMHTFSQIFKANKFIKHIKISKNSAPAL